MVPGPHQDRGRSRRGFLRCAALLLAILLLGCANHTTSAPTTFEELQARRASGEEVTEIGKCLQEAERATEAWQAWLDTKHAKYDACINESTTTAVPEPPNSSQADACHRIQNEYYNARLNDDNDNIVYQTYEVSKEHCARVRANYTQALDAYKGALQAAATARNAASEHCKPILDADEPIELRNRVTWLDCTALMPTEKN